VSSDCAARKLCTSAGRDLPPEGQEPVTKGHAVCLDDPADPDSSKGVECHERGIDCPFLLTMLPYRITSSGMLCRPTRVADVICHALSPLLSQLGDEDRFWYAIGIDPAMVSTERLVGRMGKEEEG
jgi:hypothetical protein